MVHTDGAAIRREERAERRRSQILDAARACFRAEGFHAASMSRVASTAEMSVGHIYQYYENKEAIIIALCERDFEEFMRRAPCLEGADPNDIDAVVDTALADFDWLLDADRAAITLEVIAEAGRNPKIAAVVERVDAGFRIAVREAASRLLHQLAPAEREARVEALILLVQGLTIRAATRPRSDAEQIKAGYAIALRQLLST